MKFARGKTWFRDSIVVSISACHADDPGSIPGRGVFRFFSATSHCYGKKALPAGFEPATFRLTVERSNH